MYQTSEFPTVRYAKAAEFRLYLGGEASAVFSTFDFESN